MEVWRLQELQDIANIVIYNGEDEILFQDDNNEARWSSDILTAAGFSTVKFLGDTQVFPRTIIISDIWKTFGFGTVVYLYYARAVFIASKLCEIIGDYEAENYRNHYINIKKAFRSSFMDKSGRIKSDTQSAYVISYKFGIIDMDETRENLVRKFIEDKGDLTTGFLGVKFLLPTLCDIGRSDIAYGMITNTNYPGWGYSVVNGATTIWEHWDSYTKQSGIRKGMNSFNHYSLGSCTEWMYEYCRGINPDIENPGFKKVVFAPYFDLTGKITSANGHYDTDYGRISVEWKNDHGCFEYKVSVPEEIKCDFVFNGMEVLSNSAADNYYTFRLTAML